MSTRLGRATVDTAIAETAEQMSAADTLAQQPIQAVPELVISNRLHKIEQYDPTRQCGLRYRAKGHRNLPHVVKFSGGRSSGMLLFVLLENKVLDPERGDVIVFNNTSSEHPDTYRFVRDCKEVSRRYGVPFFWVEFQTHEDARNGEWTRLPTYRLVNDEPKSPENPDGFHWRGEVFEELLSWSGYVPNQFRRTCTQYMKLEVTRMFLKDWLACKEVIPRLGHYGDSSRVNMNVMYRRHRRNRGAVPKEIFAQKRGYVLQRPHTRPEQRYGDFSSAWQPFHNETGTEYVAFVGLRADEQRRVKRIEARNAEPGTSGHKGEHVYMPLADMAVARNDVNTFWDRQAWDLSLPKEGSLSNCVYCFLKGAANLRSVYHQMEKESDAPGFGSLLDTPSDVSWWIRMEQIYGRDLEAEQREITGDSGNNIVGFFGASAKFSYELLAKGDDSDIAKYSGTLLPCDCTE